MQKLAAVLILGVLAGCASAKPTYQLSEEDQAVLADLPEEHGRNMAYVRCKNNTCYVIKSGEVVFSGPDGVWLVETISDEAEVP